MSITVPDDIERELSEIAGGNRDPQALAVDVLRKFIAHQHRVTVLREAVDAGDASGVFDGDPFDSVIEELDL